MTSKRPQKAKTKWASDEEADSEPTRRSTQKKLKSIKLPPIHSISADSSPAVANQQDVSPDIPIISRITNYLVGPKITPCRSIDEYENLNLIDEGSYGIVYRARNRKTDEIVALKKLKLEKERNGFPVTSLREIHTLLISKHPNIVDVLEILVKADSKFYIAMEFVEHDLKSLMAEMRTPFLQSEVKTLMMQLLSAVSFMHHNWIVHRDLKTSNLLMNNRGQIKVADFGLARRFGDPLGDMTQLVVTLWYRSPELLLGETNYSKEIDIWSVGCIFAELINNEPLFPGTGEIEQLNKIFRLLGTPTELEWPGFNKLPLSQSFGFTKFERRLRSKFPYLTENGMDLLSKLLCYDPKARITAAEGLKHPFFFESPAPKEASMFPTWPSKGAGETRLSTSLSKTLAEKTPSAPHVHAEMELRNALGANSHADTNFRLKF